MKLLSTSPHLPVTKFLLILIFVEDVTNARQMNDTVIDDYDSEYPYEKILELVNKTKRILTSGNAIVKREMLEFNPADYVTYLRSNDLDGQPYKPIISTSSSGVENISDSFDYAFAANAGAGPPPSHKDASSDMANCLTVTELYKPHRLKSIDGSHQFILNVGKHFVQEWRITNCFRAGVQCGNPSTWPEMYESTCRQNYRGTAKFFSVPVGREITLSQQKLREFRVPDGCNCELSAI